MNKMSAIFSLNAFIMCKYNVHDKFIFSRFRTCYYIDNRRQIKFMFEIYIFVYFPQCNVSLSTSCLVQGWFEIQLEYSREMQRT